MDAVYVSSNQFTVSGDKTSEFTQNRRLKMDCGVDGIKYASVLSSSYSAPNTTVTIDENDLTSNLSTVLYGIVQPGSVGSLPNHDHSDSEGQGGAVSLDFLDLNDTPSVYSNGQYLMSTTSGVSWVTVSGGSDVQSFLDLTDTPISFNTGKFLISTASGIEWSDITISGAQMYMARMLCDTNFSMDTATEYSIPFNIIVDNVGSMADTVNGRVNITKDGKYLITTTITRLGTVSDGVILYADIVKNGSVYLERVSKRAAAGTSTESLQVTTFATLEEGDYITISVRHDNGSTVASQFASYNPSISVIQIPEYTGSIGGGGSSDVQSFLDLNDTPSTYNSGKFLVSTSDGIDYSTISLTNQKGLQSILVDFKSSSDIYVNPGAVEINGEVYFNDSQTVVSGTISTSSWHYVYASATGGDLSFYWSTTEPSEDINNLGYYNSNDRCIGFFKSYDTYIPRFSIQGNTYNFGFINNFASWQSITTYSEFTVDVPLPKIQSNVFVRCRPEPIDHSSHVYLHDTEAIGSEFYYVGYVSYTKSLYLQRCVWIRSDSSKKVGISASDYDICMDLNIGDFIIPNYIYNGSGPMLVDSVVDTFLDLSDTPTTYSGSVGKYLRATASGIEFVDAPTGGGSSDVQNFLDLTDTPSNYESGKFLVATSSGVEWSDITVSGVQMYMTKMVCTTDISMDTGVFYPIPFNVKVHDVGNMADTVNGRVNITKDGFYLITSTISRLTSLGDGDGIYVSVVKNGNITLDITSKRSAASTAIESLQITTFSYLNKDDYIDIHVKQSTGSTQTSLFSTISPSISVIQIPEYTGGNESSVQNFIDLSDTPTTYSGAVGKYLRTTASGIEFVDAPTGGGSSDVQNFLDLLDTPTTYSGNSGKFLVATTSGIEFSDFSINSVDTDYYANELVQEWNLSNEGLDETFTWDGDVDDVIIFEVINASIPVGSNVKIRFNNDTTSNYSFAQIFNDGSSVSANIVDSSFTYIMLSNSNSTSETMKTELYLKNNGKRRVAISNVASQRTDNTDAWWYGSRGSFWNNTSDKITSFKIYSDNSDLTGTFRLYKRAKISLPMEYIPTGTKGLQSIKLEYKDVDEIYLNPGTVEINNGYYKIDSRLTKQLTSLSASTWYYIYVKPPTYGNDITVNEIEYNTSEPVRDLSKLGRYHSTNTNWRCIGAIYASNSNNITDFTQERVYHLGKALNDTVGWATFSDTWTAFTSLACPFGDTIVNVNNILDYNNYGGWLYSRKVDSPDETLYAYCHSANDMSIINCVLPVDSNRQYELKWASSTTNRVYISSYGFVVPDDIYNGSGGYVENNQTFLDLTDTPTTYSGSVGKYLRATASGIEFVDAPTGGGGSSDVQNFTDLLDTPTTYSGAVGKFLRATASGVEFVDSPLLTESDFYSYELVEEYNLSNETLDDLITGWDGDVDDHLIIEYDFKKNNSDSGGNLELVLNEDNTADNYVRAVIYHTGSDASASLVDPYTNACLCLGMNYTGQMETSGRADVYLGSGRQRKSVANCTFYSSSTAYRQYLIGGYWENTTSKVTSFRFRITEESTGWVRVYKKTKLLIPIQQPEYVESSFKAYELVKEWDLSNESVNELFDWDGENEDAYIEFAFTNTNSTGITAVVRPNDDTTSTYDLSSITATSTPSITSGWTSDITYEGLPVVITGITTPINFRGSFHTNLKKASGNSRTGRSVYNRSDSYKQTVYESFWNNTSDIVTSLRVHLNNPVTGYIRLYKLKTVSLPINGSFLDLSDTPTTYSGVVGKYLRTTASGIEFVDAPTGGGGSSDVQNFTDLLDTPTTYSGSYGKYLKATASGIEFVDILFSDLPTMDTMESDVYGLELVDEINWSNSVLNNLVSWDNDDVDVIIESEWKSDTTSYANRMFMYINSDSTTTNYTRSYIGENSGSALAGRTADYDGMMLGYMTTNSVDRDTSVANLNLRSGRPRTCNVIENRYNPSGSAWGAMRVASTWENTVDDITSLTFKTDYVSTGTIRIYKRSKVNILVSSSTGSASSFTDLDDTPATYSGSVGKYLRTTASGIEFVDAPTGGGSSDVQNFLDLTDTPTTYSGFSGYTVTVVGSGLQFTPSAISGYSPVGAVGFFAMNDAPDGWLICDGSELNKVDYPELYAIIQNIWGGTASGTTFNIPDLRSEFVRGAGLGRGHDGDHDVGTHQDASEHMRFYRSGGNLYFPYENPSSVGYENQRSSTNTMPYAASDGSASVADMLGYQSRPTNIALLPCIKYTNNVEISGGSFIGMSDTPTTYSGAYGKYLMATSSGIEFVDAPTGGGGSSDVQSFLDLDDTPTTYSGFEGKFLLATTSGLEFSDFSINSVDTDYSALKLLAEYNLDNEIMTESLSIPVGSRDRLVIEVLNLENASGGGGVKATLNNDSGNNYTYGYMYQDGSSGLQGNGTTDNIGLASGVVSSISSITHLFIKNTGRYRSAYRTEVMYKDTNTDRVVYHGGYRWMNTSSDVTSIQIYTDVVSTGTIRVYSQETVSVPVQYTPSGSVGIQSIKFSYKSVTELYVYPGTVHIEGSSFEGYYTLESEITKTFSGLGVSAWYYVYINPPTVGHTLTSTSIVYSTDAPVFNSSKRGYYHSTNDGWRCVWVIRTDGSGDIREYVSSSNKVIHTAAYSVDVENITQNTTPSTYTITVPSFTDIAYSMVRFHAASTGTNLYWRSQMVGTANDSSDRTLNTLDLILDSNKQGTMFTNAGTGTARVETYGYYVPDEIYNSPSNTSGLDYSFIDLDDTPTTYSGAVGKYLRVTASGIEFAEVSSGGGSSDVQSFLDLNDTPITYSGSVGKYLRTTASGVDFTDELHGTYLYVDGNATITGTVYASAYDSLSPLVLKAGGKTVMEADDTTGIADFKHGISINGLTISGVNDGSSPVGSIIWHAAETAPDGYLICDGSAISRSTYSALYSVIGTLYGVGDGSTTFNIPDLRSEFIRGAGLGRGLDGDHAVGTNQSGTEHLALSTNATPTRVYIGYESYFDISNNGGEDVTTGSVTGSLYFDETTGTYLNRTYKSRPRNVALLPCIRYNPRFASDEVIKYISTGKQSIKVEYATTSGIYVNPGEIHLKTTYDISNVLETRTYVDAGLTTGDGPDMYYVYASVSGSTLAFDVSLTEPTIDYTNMGWYSGDSRCIGSVYVESGGIIKRFKESRGNYTWLANLYILNSTNVTTTPTSISWVAPVYTNEIQATFYLDTYGANGGLYYADSDSTDYHHVLHAHTSGRAGMNTMLLTCNYSQQGQMYFSVNSSNACSVTQNGYIIPEYIYTGA